MVKALSEALIISPKFTGAIEIHLKDGGISVIRKIETIHG